MEFKDFEINCNFHTFTGMWLCTDKGTRTIIAVRVDELEQAGDKGPPYSIPEMVFDENDFKGCWPNRTE